MLFFIFLSISNIGVWLLAGRAAAAEREERKPALQETRERILEANITEKRRQRSRRRRDDNRIELCFEENAQVKRRRHTDTQRRGLV